MKKDDIKTIKSIKNALEELLNEEKSQYDIYDNDLYSAGYINGIERCLCEVEDIENDIKQSN